MPSLDHYETLTAELASKIVSAWGVTTVYFGWPQLEQKVAPYAVCNLPNGVQQDFRTLIEAEQTWDWEIIGVFDKPAPSSDILSDKVAKFNALARLLESDVLFAGVGEMPMVVSGPEPEGPVPLEEGAHAVALRFRLTTGQTHHARD